MSTANRHAASKMPMINPCINDLYEHVDFNEILHQVCLNVKYLRFGLSLQAD